MKEVCTLQQDFDHANVYQAPYVDHLWKCHIKGGIINKRVAVYLKNVNENSQRQNLIDM